jgi:hypothetical protein
MEIEGPDPAALDRDDVQDLEYGFAYTEAAHLGAVAGAHFTAMRRMGVPPRWASEMTCAFIYAAHGAEPDED